jgi:electron transfer flavoprotein alpha subunit
MESLLFLAHTETDGSLGRPALEALTAAKAVASGLGVTLIAGLFGETIQPAANHIAACGAVKIIGVEGPDFASSRYASDVAAAAALVAKAQAGVVITGGTARLLRCVPGAAARLGGRADTHVTGVAGANGQVCVTRWFYRQRMEGTLTRTPRPWFIVVDPGTHPAWAGTPGVAAGELLEVALPEAARRTTVTGFRAPAADAQTIRPDAQLLFVTGAGWTKKQADGQTHVPEAERLILDFLKRTRASLGSTKSLVDLSGEGQAVLSFLSHLNQVGQTGSTPRHPKGLSTCCHGEEPHTVGWRFIHERRAISLDPNCGWARGKADVLYVADAFAVMTKVNALLAG